MYHKIREEIRNFFKWLLAQDVNTSIYPSLAIFIAMFMFIFLLIGCLIYLGFLQSLLLFSFVLGCIIYFCGYKGDHK